MSRKIHDFGIAALVVAAGALAGCATAPPPIQLMDHAQAAIRSARNAGATTTAPEVLAEAERRLAAAQQLSVNGDNGKATDKAEEAEAAAATARARADAARLDNQIQQQVTVNQNLEAALQRQQAAAAAAQRAAARPLPMPAPAGSAGVPAVGSSAGTPAGGSSAPAPASTGSSAPGLGPVTLPAIQLGEPSTSAPASASSSSQPDGGVNP